MKIKMIFLRTLVALAISGVGAIQAQAQFVSDSSVPIMISADNADYQQNKTILTGAVDVRQGDVRILADKMIVFTSGDNGRPENNFSRIVAEGNFYYINSDQEVRGNRGVYTRVNDTFEVSGGVILRQKDGNILTGEKLYYNLQTRNARVVGTCKGRSCGSEGRVNILIQNTGSVAGRPS